MAQLSRKKKVPFAFETLILFTVSNVKIVALMTKLARLIGCILGNKTSSRLKTTLISLSNFCYSCIPFF